MDRINRVIVYIIVVMTIHLITAHWLPDTNDRIKILEEKFDAHDPNACRILIHAHWEFDNE